MGMSICRKWLTQLQTWGGKGKNQSKGSFTFWVKFCIKAQSWATNLQYCLQRLSSDLNLFLSYASSLLTRLALEPVSTLPSHYWPILILALSLHCLLLVDPNCLKVSLFACPLLTQPVFDPFLPCFSTCDLASSWTWFVFADFQGIHRLLPDHDTA